MSELITKAVQAIHNKECIIFPTETVYGLGADATSCSAVLKIFTLKNRPPTNPLIIHVPTIEKILSIALSLSKLEERLLEIFSPGPLSLILQKKEHIPYETTGGLETVAVRIPNHPIALEFLSQVNRPIAAPSANISGKPSPTTIEMAKYYMKDKVPIILDGGTLDIGIESSVVKIEDQKIYILRAGYITAEMIADSLGIVPIQDQTYTHASPGTRFSHYKPRAQIILFDKIDDLSSKKKSAAILHFSNEIDTQGFHYILHFGSLQEYTHALYYTFFECDKQNIKEIYCELPPNFHHGTALRDRLLRAAQS